eukprot:79171-Prymnesium_polylepis.1
MSPRFALHASPGGCRFGTLVEASINGHTTQSCTLVTRSHPFPASQQRRSGAGRSVAATDVQSELWRGGRR